MNHLLKVFIKIALPCLILVLLISYLVTTTSGLKHLIRLLNFYLPQTIHIQKIQGSLLKGFTLNQLHYQDKQFSLTLKQAIFIWDPNTLITLHLPTATLNLNDITVKPISSNYRLLPATHAANPLPPYFHLAQLHLTHSHSSKKQTWEVNSHWQDLSILGFHEKTLTSSKGTLTIYGEGKQYHLKLAYPLTGIGLHSDWLFLGNGDNHQIKLHTLNNHFLGGRVQSMLQLHWQPKLAWHLTLNTDQITTHHPSLPTPFNLSLTSTGSLNHWSVISTLKKAMIPSLGIGINEANLTLAGEKANQIITLKSQVTTQDGSLHLQGNSTKKPIGRNTALTLTSNQLLLMNTDEYKVYIKPDLSLNHEKNHLTVTGNLLIPQAKLKPFQFNNKTISIPNDVKIDQPQTQTTTQIETDLTIQLGDKIYFDLLGLKGRLQGQLNLEQHPQSNLRANGELSIIDGKYKAYGQFLNVTEGRLIFTDLPLDNPRIQLKAVRPIHIIEPPILSNTATGTSHEDELIKTHQSALETDLKVGVQIRGELSAPQISLFSEPAHYSDGDILSYLFTGQSLSQLNDADAQSLFHAATLFNLGQDHLSIGQQLQNQLGLDELSIEASELPTHQVQENVQRRPFSDNTSLVLGKALSPRLYLNYSIGLFQPINILKARYLFNKKWTLQTQTSRKNSGIDLFYTIEK